MKAVVRITLKKAQGEGISFQDNLGGIYQYGHTLTNNLDVNYRTGGLDVTASLWAGRYGHWKSLQENDLTYYVGPDFYLGRSNQERKSVWKGWSPQLQVNYMLDENHSFGAFYKYDRHPSYDTNGFFNTDNYVNGVYSERSESRISGDDSFRKHIFNAYYRSALPLGSSKNGKVGNLGIDWNVDGLFDKTVEHNSTEETTIDANNVRSSHDVKNGAAREGHRHGNQREVGCRLRGVRATVRQALCPSRLALRTPHQRLLQPHPRPLSEWRGE